MIDTPLDALIVALREAGEYDPAVEAAPEAILWCDEKREFHAIIPALRQKLPQLFSLGDHDPETRTGPALWLRAAIGRAQPDVTWSEGEPAVLYLPGVSRETLRAAESCPPGLELLAWLTVSGTLFGHVNGKDWTLRGFLAAERGRLRLDVPEDGATRLALAAAAAKLFSLPLSELRGRRLDETFLTQILAPDLVADTLDWLDGRLDARRDPSRFAAFAQRAKKELKLDPSKISREQAAARLAKQDGEWAKVWAQFERAPGFHEETVKLLEGLPPPEDLLANRAAYPRLNDDHEAAARKVLLSLADKDQESACFAVAKLATDHAWRRETVWARSGRAPLVLALASLEIVAGADQLPVTDAASFAAAYAERGWCVDIAALDALAAAEREEDRAAIAAALHSVYLPWLEANAVALQNLLRRGALPIGDAANIGECDAVLFVDGLRMDLGRRLSDLIAKEGARVDVAWRWAGFPTVTATCKPLASPAAAVFRGNDPMPDFLPVTESGRRPARKDVLDRELARLGWQVTPALLPEEKLWQEVGHFDHDGHAIGARFAGSVAAGLRDVADTVLRLARSGRRVRVVTDHGWLLLPGGLPRAKLDSGLTDTKWSRCALVKEGAPATAIQMPWTWNRAHFVATAPGACAFSEGQEYAHGGISPQESIVPELTVSPLTPPRRAAIVEAQWRGLRVRIVVDQGDGLIADLRLGAEGDGPSICDRPRTLDADGRTSLLVPDDANLGRQALLTVSNEKGSMVATRSVTVGEEAH